MFKHATARWFFFSLQICLCIGFWLNPIAQAEVPLFVDGEVVAGALWSDNPQTTATLDEAVTYPPANTPTLKISYDNAFRGGGLSFYGLSKLDSNEPVSLLRIALYADDAKAGLSEIRLKTDSQNYTFGNGKGTWTVDGKPGQMDLLTPAAWHVVELDLAATGGVLPAGKIKGHLSFVSNRDAKSGWVLHIGEAKLSRGDGAAVLPAEPGDTQPEVPRVTPPKPVKPAAKTQTEARATTSPGPVTLTIHPEPLQTITQWGFATHNRPDWGKDWDIAQHPASLDALYNEVGATVIRFHIDYNTFDKQWAKEDLRDAILAVTNKGLAWYGTPWSPPVHFKTLDTVNGRLKGEINRLKPGYEDDVAKWLVELTQWLESEGVPLPLGLSPQNEPDWPPPSYPGCIYTGEQIRTAIVELRKALDAAGYTGVKVLGDEGGSATAPVKEKSDHGTINMLGMNEAGAFFTDPVYRNALDIITTHTYDLHNNFYTRYPGFLKDFSDAALKTGKELWMTEWQVRHEHTFNDWQVITENLNHFNRDMSSLGFNGWIYWQPWKGWLLPDGPPESGQQIGRIRAGDVLIYKQLDLGNNPGFIDLRVGSDSPKMTFSIHLGSAEAAPLVSEILPEGPKFLFTTHRIKLPDVSGKHDVYLKFSSPEHWREASLNWFAFGDNPPIEAESLDDAIRAEKWSSKVADSYYSLPRIVWVHDDGVTQQRRPTFYIYKKIWNNAPAGKGTTVRRVTSSNDDVMQGESKAARVESHRQDVSAFVYGDKTTLVILNRNDHPQQVNIEGVVGQSARVYSYLDTDAETVNIDMRDGGTITVTDGRIDQLTMPERSIYILIVTPTEPE